VVREAPAPVEDLFDGQHGTVVGTWQIRGGGARCLTEALLDHDAARSRRAGDQNGDDEPREHGASADSEPCDPAHPPGHWRSSTPPKTRGDSLMPNSVKRSVKCGRTPVGTAVPRNRPVMLIPAV